MLCKTYTADFIDQGLSELKESNCEISIEDKKFIEIMNKECTQEGKHKLTLPLRDPDSDFPNNRNLTTLKLHNVKKRFNHERSFHEDYTKFINGRLSKGHAQLEDQRKF